jgi:branched-chain amino acid transport system substrate-binding protein
MKRLILAAALAVLAPWANAQIVIGQTTGLSGPEADAAKDNATGAQLYFERVNASGGVNGQKIELITLDDKADPKLSAANAKTLITENNAIALFMTRGTAQTMAVEGLLAEN